MKDKNAWNSYDKEELAKLMYQNLDAKAGLDLLMTAKYMERIGDHALNIAQEMTEVRLAE